LPYNADWYLQPAQGEDVRRIGYAYFLTFYFWFQLDLLTKSREIKALKAMVAVTITHVWLALGAYWWCEILVGLPKPRAEWMAGTVVALFAANMTILRSGGWETFEKTFAQLPGRTRRARLALGALVSIGAFALLLSAATIGRAS
jgi:hypothetical protein